MKKRKNVNQNTPFAAFFFISVQFSLFPVIKYFYYLEDKGMT